MTANEKKLHDYLDDMSVNKGNPDMQAIVINSFYKKCDMDNEDEWEEKVAFIGLHFDLFCRYIKEDWLSDNNEGGNSTIQINAGFEIPNIRTENLKIIDLPKEASTTEAYKNLPVAITNDHVVRLAIMTEHYFWHMHPDSDECFLVLEGTLLIDLEDEIIELNQNQLFNIPRNVIHRTRPKGERVVNVTFERCNTTTVKIER